MQKQFLLLGAALLATAQGCCGIPQLGKGLSRDKDGFLHVQVPSERAKTISEALDIACEPLHIELGKGEFRVEEDDVDRVREFRTLLRGAGHWDTIVSVPEDQHHLLEKHCDNLYLSRRREFQSSFVKFWSDLGEGLYKLFRFIVTGR